MVVQRRHTDIHLHYGAPPLPATLPVPAPHALRLRAEEIESGQTGQSHDDINKLSPDAAKTLIHELRVHQIELEMQNENLRSSYEQLEASRTRYFELYDLSPVGYCTLNDEGKIIQANLTTARLLGVERGKLLQQALSPFFRNENQDDFYRYIRQVMLNDSDDALAVELQMKRWDGTQFWGQLVATRARDDGGMPVLRLVISDITSRHNDEEEIRRLAFFDPLTNLPNRRLLVDRLGHAMHGSARDQHYGALMFLDLDHFKIINDTLGHAMGDLLLQQVARRLQTCVREGDSVARLGGDEFVILLEGLSKNSEEAAGQAEAVAKKINAMLGQQYDLHRQTYHITPSLGIVMFVQDQEKLENLLRNADVAMYQAKSSGRNQARFFDPAMQAAAEARNALELDLRHGLDRQEFKLLYQVQTRDTGEITGAEALVRWHHPKRGLISPAMFIPLAEETRLILPLGQWVLETACRQLAVWSKHPVMASWSMAVNVSALQFSHAGFVENVIDAINRTGAKPGLLKLELTESMLVNDVAGIIEKMNALGALGIRFSLDDFGTGYSSLNYLKRLPIAQLKIDQSFVRDVLTDPSDEMICRTIIALGHSLKLEVIAEGVETAEQADFLTRLGCDAFQGYFFGRPTEAGELA